MKVKQIPTGIIIGDKEVVGIELLNNKGTYVKIFNYGAIINKFIIANAKGEKQDIVLGFDEFEQYLDPGYLANNAYIGAVVGRYANRIKNASFSMEGQTYQLAENTAGACLHGGIEGFDKKVWDIVEIDQTSAASVTLQYESPDGEEHFPGNMLVELRFELTDFDELILSYEAETDQPTAVNLTHHGYFNLAPEGGTVAGHQLQIFASNYLEQDAGFCTTGKLIPVKNTPLDFTQPKAIGQNWDSESGYDQTFVLDKTYGDLTLASRITASESGLTLSVYTTEPVAHLYTSRYLNVKNGKSGVDYGRFDAFCIETQHHPNAINIDAFPSTVLHPENLYTQTTIYKVSQ